MVKIPDSVAKPMRFPGGSGEAAQKVASVMPSQDLEVCLSILL
jgi:hypothetical protein